MSALAATRLDRMGHCETDLARNGIDLLGAGERAMRLLVRRHLDYFQLMLGYDARPGEVVALARLLGTMRNGAAAGRRVPGTSGRVAECAGAAGTGR